MAVGPGVDHDIVGFHVAVEDKAVMERGQRCAEVLGDVETPEERNVRVANIVVEGDTGGLLHDDGQGVTVRAPGVAIRSGDVGDALERMEDVQLVLKHRGMNRVLHHLADHGVAVVVRLKDTPKLTAAQLVARGVEVRHENFLHVLFLKEKIKSASR